MNRKTKIPSVAGALFLIWTASASAAQVRLKTIAKIKGVRENQLIGYGLVVGLERTGDTQRVASTLQSITNMLSQFGIVISPSQIRTQNVRSEERRVGKECRSRWS